MKKLLFLILLIALLQQANAQNTGFCAMGNSNYNSIVGWQVIQTNDGGYLTAGFGDNLQTLKREILLVKTNADFSTQWIKVYNDTSGSFSFDRPVICQSQIDSGYFIAAPHSNYSTSELCLIRTDKTGNLLWSKCYAGIEAIGAAGISQAASGNIYIMSSTTDHKIFVVKADANGNLIHGKKYNVYTYTNASGFRILQNENIVIAGGSSSGTQMTFIAKIDSSGSILWSKTFTGIVGIDNNNFVLTDDGGFLFAGTTSLGDPVWTLKQGLLKIDSSGNFKWAKTYYTNGLHNGEGLVKMSNQGYAVACTTNVVMAVDTIGNFKWAKAYNNSNTLLFRDMIYTNDENLVVAGTVMYDQLFMMKIDTNGNSHCPESTLTPQITSITLTEGNFSSVTNAGSSYSIQIQSLPLTLSWDTVCITVPVENYPERKNEIKIFPNPAQDRITIEFENPAEENSVLNLYNSMGSLIYQQKCVNRKTKYTINISQFPSGMYFVKCGVNSIRFLKL